MQTTLSSAFYRPTSYSARYTFSGKERDEESGFSYFGSRYYNSAYSIWMSVDPMSDKYPSISPYAYCGSNPIKLVDPSGEEVINQYKPAYDYFNKQLKVAKEKFDSFGGNKKADGYKEAKKEYNKAKRNFSSAEYKYKEVNSAISNVKRYNSELYDKMDNLKDKNGKTVDIIVGIDYSKSNKGWGGVPNESESPSALYVSLNPLTYLTQGYTDMGEVLTHEFGHYLYIVPNWSEYQDFLNTKVDRATHNGHDFDDKPGIEANKQTDIYRNNKNNRYGF